MSPDAEITQTVADSITWMNWWGGWCLLAMAAVMALAAARELWPLVGLHLATRNRLTPGRCLVDGIIEPGQEQSPVVVQVDQEYMRGIRFRRWVERSRRVEIAQFHIRLDDGRRVRVVPADQLAAHGQVVDAKVLDVFQRGQPLAILWVIGGWVTCLLALWIYWRSFRPWYRRFNVNQTDF